MESCIGVSMAQQYCRPSAVLLDALGNHPMGRVESGIGNRSMNGWVFPKIEAFPPKWMVYNGKPY